MRLHDLAWVSLLVALPACAHPQARSSSPPRDLSPDPSQPTALETTQAVVETGPPRAPKLEFSETEGESATRLQSIFARAAGPLHRCLPGQSPGKIILRVSRKDGVLSVSPAAGFALDDAGRSCALEALQNVYLTETGSNAGGVSIPPSGFTSLLTVAW